MTLSSTTAAQPHGNPPSHDLTVMILTFNEAPNLRRTLSQLTWAKRIVLIDSGSQDDTLKIAAEFTQVEVFHRPFDSFAAQCNFGLAQIGSSWVLSLDADYVLSDALVQELKELRDDGFCAFRARFIYCIHGRRLRGTLYPPRTVLYRRKDAYYVDCGHGHKVIVPGVIGALKGVIFHDDRKALVRWMGSQIQYARREADYLMATPKRQLTRNDRIRRTGVIAPLIILPYVLLRKGCILDGLAGWRYGLERLFAEVAIALALLERRLAPGALADPVLSPELREPGNQKPHSSEESR
jgi:glycosyltransferase involved in cell wall biosynthesis